MPSKPTSHFVTANGVKLRYLQWGSEGTPIVIEHANSHCGGVWGPVVSRLEGQYCVRAFDLRGHGLSDKPERGYDWGSLRDDLVGALEALDLRDVILIGHSRGGGASILAACKAPDRVAAAFFYEPTMSSGQEARGRALLSDAPQTSRGEQALRRRPIFESRQAIFDSYRPRGPFEHWTDEALWAYIEHGTKVLDDGQAELLCPPWVEAKLYDELAFPDEWIGIRNESLPVLLCFGELSGRAQPGDPAAALRRIFPRTEYRILPGMTHFGPMEKPQEMASAIESFVADYSPVRS
jgi:pimeloyl-ACP methyl ester carboxylesterase